MNLYEAAEQQKIPLRTLEQVKADIEEAKKTKADVALARVMYRFGRLTPEAKEYAQRHCGL